MAGQFARRRRMDQGLTTIPNIIIGVYIDLSSWMYGNFISNKALGIVGAALKGQFRRNGAERRNPEKPDRLRSRRERPKTYLL